MKTSVNRSGKFLTFRLATEESGGEILHVQGIIGMMAVTHVPRVPPSVRGVANLRGRVNPVEDLRLKFAMESNEDTQRTCIIVVQVGGSSGAVTTDFIVDAVSEVMDISGEEIEDAPSFGASLDTACILSMAKTKVGVKIPVDLDKVLGMEKITRLEKMA